MRAIPAAGRGCCNGALSYTLRTIGGRSEALPSDLVVAKHCRRQGIATRLMEELAKNFPGVRSDTAITGDGAAFMGYAAPAAAEAARPATARLWP